MRFLRLVIYTLTRIETLVELKKGFENIKIYTLHYGQIIKEANKKKCSYYGYGTPYDEY